MLNHPTDIYGHGKNTQKSKGYAGHSAFGSAINTYTCVDKEVHGRKRRILNQAFTAGAISSYESIILSHIRYLCETLSKFSKSEWPLVRVDGWSLPQNMIPWSMYLRISGGENLLT